MYVPRYVHPNYQIMECAGFNSYQLINNSRHGLETLTDREILPTNPRIE